MHSRRDVASLPFIKSSLRRLDFNQYELSDPCTVISRQAQYSICAQLVKQCVVIKARPLLMIQSVQYNYYTYRYVSRIPIF